MRLIETIKIEKLGDVNIRLTVSEEFCPVKGNVLASGNDAEDEKVIKRIAQGDVWAWCMVTITASLDELDFEGNSYLGCCSYKNQKDFLAPGGYYEDMKGEAIEELKGQIELVLNHAKTVGMLEALT
jgi:hypothetical protein